MLMKQVHQNNLIFVTIGVLKILVFSMNHIFAMAVQKLRSYDLMQKAMSFNNFAIVYVKGSVYRIHFCYMSKDDAISIMNNSNFVDKKGFFNFFYCI